MGRPEVAVHRAVLHLMRVRLPGAVIHHSPNESGLPSSVARIAGVKARSLGALTGFPDLLAIWRGQVFAFEVKAPRGRLSDAQAAVGAQIIENGGRWAVVRSVDEADAHLAAWKAQAAPYAVIEVRGSVS